MYGSCQICTVDSKWGEKHLPSVNNEKWFSKGWRWEIVKTTAGSKVFGQQGVCAREGGRMWRHRIKVDKKPKRSIFSHFRIENYWGKMLIALSTNIQCFIESISLPTPVRDKLGKKKMVQSRIWALLKASHGQHFVFQMLFILEKLSCRLGPALPLDWFE